MSRTMKRGMWFYGPTSHYNFPRILHLSVSSILFLSIATNSKDNNDQRVELACQGHTFSISCNGRTIRISHAIYGRLNINTCPYENDRTNWKRSCVSLHATTVLQDKCNNLTTCTLNPGSDNTFYNSLFGGDPCLGTTKYLSANYTCLPAILESVQTSIMPTLECQCSAETKRGVIWPRTKCNNIATRTCPNNDQEHANRSCTKYEWRHLNFVKCVRKEIENLKSETDELKRSLSVVLIKQIMSKVKNISRFNDLYGGDLYELTRIMLDLMEISLNTTTTTTVSYSNAEELTQMVLNSTGNLLLNVNNEIWMDLMPLDRSQTAGRLLDALETSCKVLAKAAQSQKSINKAVPGIELKMDVINGTQAESVRFATSDLRLHISLEVSGVGLASIVFVTYDDIEKRLGVIPLSNDMKQVPNEASTESMREPRDNDTSIQPFIITKVVSMLIVSCDQCSVKIKFPIRFTLQHKWESPNTTSPSCVFWKYTKHDYVGHWSADGCTVVSSNRYNTTCECNHLTAYSVLMSGVSQSAIVTKVSGIFTIIGCSISVVALILTIIIYAVTWKEVKSHQAVVLLNLCVALIAAQIIFLTGVDKVQPEIGCKVVAALLHYFFLAAFFIMLVEGIQLLIYAVFVFHAKRKRETASLLVAAWVLPLIIVSISLGVSKTGDYGSKDICWLSVQNNFIWAFVGPVLTIVGVNVVITIIVLTRTYASNLRSNQTSKSKIRGMFWNVAVIFPILGLTWILGVFSQSSVFAFIFTIVNSLQGLFILIFHAIFLNKRVGGRLSSLAMRCMSFARSFKRQKPSYDERAIKSNAVRVGECCYNEIQSQSFPNTNEAQTFVY